MAEVSASFREVRCISSQRLLTLGISMTHLHVLTMLRHHGPLSMSRLAELLDVSFSNTTGIVDRIEERGLVERTRVPDDRRVVLVRLTPAGERLLDDVDAVRTDLIGGAIDRLTAPQLERLEAASRDIRDALRAELESAPELYAHDHHDREPAAS